jgi:hypothetical protein
MARMRLEDYPALFRSADDASDTKQCIYLFLIKTEYALLFVAAVLFMDVFVDTTFYLFYALVFLASIGTLLTRALMKPEQDWYRCRALAESVKTLTWRYMMRAEPFLGAAATARAEFTQHLQLLFNENRLTAQKISSNWADADQITTEMDRVRTLNLDDRKAFYVAHRVQEQRSWYGRKATENKKIAKRWVAIGIACYVLAIILAVSRIKFPEWHIWPIEPVIVFASSAIGWMQIKKFNELGAAYTVAAHEIGLIRPRADVVHSEDDFSEFVNDAEKAFSREHTLWIARQSD